MQDRAREWWNAWADEFQDAAEAEPSVAWGPGSPPGDDLGLLGDLDGTRAIELGCGGGQFGVAVSLRGADVTGVDISEEQLAYARELADEHGEDVEFVEASVTAMPMIDDGAYDLAFCAYALQWVEDLEACFDEAYRVLRDGGRFVFSVDHPFYKLFDPETEEFRASYFDGEPRRVYSEAFDAEMVVYRRKVGEVVNLLVDAGFTVTELREPGYDDPGAYESTFGGFEPELMANVPPTVVYAAEK
jgi:SAM-dependent methyltransferase